MGPRPSPLPGWEDEQSVSRTVLYKKVTKPLLERQRRARINRCLDELKELMSATLAAEGENLTKLEKADVLELTVRHLHQLHREGELSLSGPGSSLGRPAHGSSSVLENRRYQGGFLACAQQVASYVTKFPGVEPGVSQRLMAHLGNCAQQICDTTTHTAPPALPGLPFLSPAPVNLRSMTSTPLVSTSAPLAFPHLSPVNLSNPPPPSAQHFLPFNPSLCLAPPTNRAASNPPAHPTSVVDRESAFKIPSLPNPTAEMAPTSQLTSPKDNPINLSQTPLTIAAKRSGSGDTINAPKKRFLNAIAQQGLLASAQSANTEEVVQSFSFPADVKPPPVLKLCSPNGSSEEPRESQEIPRSSNAASEYNILNLSLDAESSLHSNKARVAQALNLSSSTVTINQPPAPATPTQASSLPVAIGSTLTITPYLYGYPMASPSPGTDNSTGQRSLPLDMSDSDQDMWRPW